MGSIARWVAVVTDDSGSKYSDTPMPSHSEDLLRRIAVLAEELSSWADPEVALRAEELLDLVDAFHRNSLHSLVELIESEGSEGLIKKALRNDDVRVLLGAYDLDTEGEPIAEIVENVVNELRPLVQLHNGDFQAVEFSESEITLQLEGTCVDCPSARAILGDGIRDLFQQHKKDLRVTLLPQDAKIDAEKSDLICGIPSDTLSPGIPIPVKLGRKINQTYRPTPFDSGLPGSSSNSFGTGIVGEG